MWSTKTIPHQETHYTTAINYMFLQNPPSSLSHSCLSSLPPSPYLFYLSLPLSVSPSLSLCLFLSLSLSISLSHLNQSDSLLKRNQYSWNNSISLLLPTYAYLLSTLHASKMRRVMPCRPLPCPAPCLLPFPSSPRRLSVLHWATSKAQYISKQTNRHGPRHSIFCNSSCFCFYSTKIQSSELFKEYWPCDSIVDTSFSFLRGIRVRSCTFYWGKKWRKYELGCTDRVRRKKDSEMRGHRINEWLTDWHTDCLNRVLYFENLVLN